MGIWMWGKVRKRCAVYFISVKFYGVPLHTQNKATQSSLTTNNNLFGVSIIYFLLRFVYLYHPAVH